MGSSTFLALSASIARHSDQTSITGSLQKRASHFLKIETKLIASEQ
jgi:hypothetical protein